MSQSQWPTEVEQGNAEKYTIRLYVAGLTVRSTETLARLQAICEEHLAGRYELEVIDIYQQPELASEGQIVVTPTLIRVLPAPLRRLVGDLQDTEKVLRGLNIKPSCTATRCSIIIGHLAFIRHARRYPPGTS